MHKWQGIRRAHCVIDRISSRASTSSSASRHSRQYHHQASFQTHPQRQTLLITSTRQFAHLPSPRVSHSTIITRNMSSDDAYMSFLNKANADLNTARNQPSENVSSAVARTETVDAGVRVPAPLTSVDAFYISETDEPFEPVTLKWDGASRGLWPDAAHLSSLISPSTDLSSSITTLPASSFDPKNQYPGPLRAVRAAVAQASGGGIDESAVEVKAYRVEVGTSRVEYYLVALDAEQGLLVGLRAKAVET
ncbi:hypothetical protein P170DRAFT_465415 [Aspergillus steynii IBT 23096]|uniref:Uncharacterized protein n=1 Tax=Aspergillus steynii IBT 23096 TaxID=1392250 RepID=A0A2I2G4T5_9EURO|nr:uncharacterized protein P170DRAFT_465415 [Aspergillus steynii IBT 23096]PLB47890.1 hypothetical protein P170DRAFT_465415 [Aspergillus steynii IBT 23096]